MPSIFSDSWINLVFEGRNKKYGAYDLRKRSVRNASIAMVISVSLFSFVLALPVIVKALSNTDDDKLYKPKTLVDVELLAPPPLDPNEPPPPPPEKLPPLKNTIKLTPPVIVPDEEVTEEDEPPPQEAFEDAEAGSVTEEGDTGGVDLSQLDISGEDVIGDPEPDKVFIQVEQMPEFPGGEAALLKYLTSIRYPDIAKDNDIEGSVFVRFVIDKNGQVTNAEVAKGTDKVLNDAALEHVKKMPAWKAGKQNGKEVKVQYVVPIKFVLN